MTFTNPTKIVTSQSKKVQAVRYVITGGIATALQYGLYLLCTTFTPLSATLSAMVSYGLSFIFNFVFSNLFTFRTKPNGKKAVSFVLSHLINLGLQTGLVAIFSMFISKAYALLPAMAICIPVNFILVRLSLTSKWVQSK